MKEIRPPNRSKKKKENVTSFVVEKKEALLQSLIDNLPHKNRKILKAVLRDKQVSVDGDHITQFDHGLIPGQRVDVRWNRDVDRKHLCPLDIIQEDQDIIVINKPPGLLTIATEKEKRRTAYSILSDYIKTENPDNKIFIIHRIDRETSGLLMFARSEKVKQRLQRTWNTTISQRTYIGVVEGEVMPPKGTISSWLTESKAFTVYSSKKQGQGKRAVTHYKKIMGRKTLSMLQINLDTGRKHQIRVHMQDLGHPVIGDKKYGSKLNPLGRMCLHAQVLEFKHPTTGKLCHFDTGIPEKFLKLFTSTRGQKKANSS